MDGRRSRRGKGSIQRVAVYSVLHLLVDGLCALAMFGVFLQREKDYLYSLLYNFCAFAMQMPFGVILDALGEETGAAGALPEKAGIAEVRSEDMETEQLREGRYSKLPVDRPKAVDYAFAAVVTGVLFTAAGVFTHPVILGIGNALFHVGGGVGTMEEDRRGGWKGRGLGVFVAPGALGLYLGTMAAKQGGRDAGILAACLLSAGLLCVEFVGRRYGNGSAEEINGTAAVPGPEGKWFGAAISCFGVVILRSYIGMTSTFPWKKGILPGILAVLALVGGKVAGGFGAAKWGFWRMAAASLGAAALCYLFSSNMVPGLAAVFFFNMTMPMTLYGMACAMPDRPGFAFGFLTFALFLGFLPVYFGALLPVEGSVAGCAGSILSLLLLWAGIGRRGDGSIFSGDVRRFPGADHGD